MFKTLKNVTKLKNVNNVFYIYAFVMVSTVWSVSCFLFFLGVYPKSAKGVPAAPFLSLLLSFSSPFLPTP